MFGILVEILEFLMFVWGYGLKLEGSFELDNPSWFLICFLI